MSAAASIAWSASTRYCAVYGHPVRHSASPAMQNAGIAALGLDWGYVAFNVRPEHLREALVGAKAMRFVGLNLTVPHKLLALERVDVLDESARLWGAVNTIRYEAPDDQGQWHPLAEVLPESVQEVRAHGFNTDAEAIVQALREDLDFEASGANILVLGTGGAGRVAALKLAAEGAGSLHLVNRTRDKAEALAQEIRRRYPLVQVALGYPSGPVELVLNATSQGLKTTDAMPLDETRFPVGRALAVYDMIYRPAETPLLHRAREAGCQIANGLTMLLYQGARALEIWSGRKAPLAVMREALERNVYGR